MLFTGLAMLAFMFFTKKDQPKNEPPASVVVHDSTAARATTNRAEKVVPLGGLKDGYKLVAFVNTRGAGLDLVELAEYTKSVKDSSPFALLHNDASGAKPFATTKLTINGNAADLTEWTWELVKAEPGEVILQTEPEALDVKTGKPHKIARIQKIFTLKPGSYDVHINHKIENLTDEPLTVSIDQFGPFNIPLDSNRGEDRSYQLATYNSEKKFVKTDAKVVSHAGLNKNNVLHSETLGDFSPETDPALWVAASNRFFTVIVRPEGGPGFDVNGGLRQVNIPRFAAQTSVGPVASGAENVGVLIKGNTVGVPAKAKVDLSLDVFMGPKQRQLLAGDLKAPVGSESWVFATYHYFDIIQFSQGGPCGFCTFSWLSTSILWLLDAIYKYVLGGWQYGYGVAIMILVIVIRLLLHPLTRYSQVSMAKMQKKMAAIKPELERAKKKYEKDKAKQQQETMRIYKEHEVNPAGGIAGCLPMLIQMPIWIALYAGLQIDIDLRHAAFIPGWISDLANPDTVIAVTNPAGMNIPILSMLIGPVHGLNLLPILLGLVFFVQMRISMANMPAAADEQTAQTQKISQYMILLFPLFLYGSPSGLNVYIFASTLGGIFDTWLVRKHLRREGLLPAQSPTGPMM